MGERGREGGIERGSESGEKGEREREGGRERRREREGGSAGERGREGVSSFQRTLPLPRCSKVFGIPRKFARIC